MRRDDISDQICRLLFCPPRAPADVHHSGVSWEKWVKCIDRHAFCHIKTKKRRKHWERPLLFPLHTFSKTLLFSHSLSQPALLPVIALIQHQPVYLPPPLSGIKVAVIGVIIQLYADSLSLNPLRSALCHAWLTCLRWCQVLAVSRRLPYATVLLSPLMSVRWLSVWAEGRAQCAAAHSRRAPWQSHAPSSAVNTDKVAAAQQCRRWVTTKFFLEGKGRTELNIIL